MCFETRNTRNVQKLMRQEWRILACCEFFETLMFMNYSRINHELIFLNKN